MMGLNDLWYICERFICRFTNESFGVLVIIYNEGTLIHHQVISINSEVTVNKCSPNNVLM